MYCVLEHAFYTREGDAQRTVLRFTPLVAPYKTTIFPLVKSEDLLPAVSRVSSALEAAAISSIEDTTGARQKICASGVLAAWWTFPDNQSSCQFYIQSILAWVVRTRTFLPPLCNTRPPAYVHIVTVSTGTSIGRRYARTDEVGVPFGITVDKQTLEDDTVTLRERDSTAQVRLHPFAATTQFSTPIRIANTA